MSVLISKRRLVKTKLLPATTSPNRRRVRSARRAAHVAAPRIGGPLLEYRRGNRIPGVGSRSRSLPLSAARPWRPAPSPLRTVAASANRLDRIVYRRAACGDTARGAAVDWTLSAALPAALTVVRPCRFPRAGRARCNRTFPAYAHE